jgi:hypothetical protein
MVLRQRARKVALAHLLLAEHLPSGTNKRYLLPSAQGDWEEQKVSLAHPLPLVQQPLFLRFLLLEVLRLVVLVKMARLTLLQDQRLGNYLAAYIILVGLALVALTTTVTSELRRVLAEVVRLTNPEHLIQAAVAVALPRLLVPTLQEKMVVQAWLWCRIPGHNK